MSCNGGNASSSLLKFKWIKDIWTTLNVTMSCLYSQNFGNEKMEKFNQKKKKEEIAPFPAMGVFY